MLYQTRHTHFFKFHTFTSTPLSATNTTSLLSSSSSAQEMECVEAALKTSLRKEMALKPSPHVVSDDLWEVNFQNGVCCDEDFVDDFLDFSNDDGFVEQQEPQEEEEEEEEEEENKRNLSVSPKKEQLQLEEHDPKPSINFDDFGPIPAGELAVPADDVENLEWLSHFVEDSFSEYSAPFPAGTFPLKPEANESEPEIPVLTSPCFNTPVPAKARSKRTRTGGRVWSLGSPSLSDTSSSSTSTSNSSCPSSPWLFSTSPGSFSSPEAIEKPKRQKKKSVTEMVSVAGGLSSIQFSRRCTHCGVQKTPQWRTGPLGAKTLCNACGVRYKSGRLLPEYRPACSPTFSSELHSNHHRKVLEMRRKKEILGQAKPGLAPPVVPSF